MRPMLFEFEMKDGNIVPADQEAGFIPLEVSEETETYCDCCAWHDKFKILKTNR